MSSATLKNGHQTPNGELAAGGRDGNGRFVKGNKLGRGNPFARRVAALRRALLQAVGTQDVRDVAYSLLFKAKAGDVAAAKLLFGYVLGKPAAVVNPDTLDLEEWQVRAQAPACDEAEAVMDRVPLKLLNVCANAMDIVHWQTAEEELHLNEPPKSSAKAKPGAGAPKTARPAADGNGKRKPAPITAKSLNSGRLTAGLGLPQQKAKPQGGRKESIFKRLRREGDEAAGVDEPVK